MQRTARLIYLDSSALVKLVIKERESADLAAYLVAAPMRASCSLAASRTLPSKAGSSAADMT